MSGFHRGLAALTVAAVALTVAGCTADAALPQKTETPEYVSTWEEPAATEIAPIRGTAVPLGSLAHSAIAAKIDNHPDARPQVGLERTDAVFEELVEGGLTRYVGVWQSDIPELLGPVRSIRPMDPDIISPLGGIVAYSGGQERFVNLMRQTPVYNAIHGQADTADTFYRSDDKDAPHNVIVKAQAVLAAHSDIPAPPQQFAYALDVAGATATKDGSPTESIDYRFSNQIAGSWTWDAAAAAFLRSQAGAADVDASGAQLKATNVVVLRVPVTVSQDIPKTELIGSGEAWISTGGATVHGTWSKSAATSQIRLVDDRGITVRLGAGNTWFELVPMVGSVTFVPPAAG